MNKFSKRLFALKEGYSFYKKLMWEDDDLLWKYNYSPHLNKFDNINKGKHCIIIGNGPSLNKMDLTPLKDYYTFGLNKIFLYDKCDLDLTYLVAVNPLVIEQSKEVYEKFNKPVFLSYINSKNKIDDKEHIFRINSKSAFGFGTNMLSEIYEGGTVTNIALQIAFSMGFTKVALIGVDHNFQQEGKPNSEQVLKEEDINHFHPDYFKGQKWHLADLEANEISYSLANYYFERNNRKVVDATVDGKLNIFEKANYNDVLKNFEKRQKK